MHRRHFLALAAASSVGLATTPCLCAADWKPVSARKLPRWRGFNLLEKFIARPGGNPAYAEKDFSMMAEWGFDFVRLPMSYHCWASSQPTEWLVIREEEIRHIDQAIEFGRQHGIHVNLNFHRAPGYCVNPPAEPLELWRNEQALDAAAHHWAWFARRFKSIPSERLSFDLLNEPPDVPEATYVRVVKRLVAAIRAEDPNRLIIADGRRWGRDPVEGLIDLGIAQSTRGYDPMEVSHWKANWVKGADAWPEPTWPLKPAGKRVWDQERLRRERIQPWKALEARGVGVHVGEWGPYHHTPHAVALAWMRDQLELWKEAGWGWAMWNFRGDFGPIESGRKDVQYETVRGLKVDRAMLELIQKY